MLGFGPLCEVPLCSLLDVVVPPIPPSGGGGGNFAQGGGRGGGKRHLPKLEELDVFKCLERRRPGQTIIECLRELDNPQAEQIVEEAVAEVASIRQDDTGLRMQEFKSQIADLRMELTSIQGFLREQEEQRRKQQEDDDDDDYLFMMGML